MTKGHITGVVNVNDSVNVEFKVTPRTSPLQGHLKVLKVTVCPPKKLPISLGDAGPRVIHDSLSPVRTPNGISIGSAVFVVLAIVFNRQIHPGRATSVTIGRCACDAA